jgi:hypothetical protein
VKPIREVPGSNFHLGNPLFGLKLSMSFLSLFRRNEVQYLEIDNRYLFPNPYPLLAPCSFSSMTSAVEIT